MANQQLAYLSLGSNLGDPIEQIVSARQAIYEWQFTDSGRCSFLYVSSPVGYEHQADFVNCVLQIRTSAQPQQLLQFCQTLELNLGRERDPGNQNAPRTIDIDILVMDEQIVDQSNLILPHPRMNQRLFVLLPLLDLLHGDDAQVIQDIIEQGDFRNQAIYRLAV